VLRAFLDRLRGRKTVRRTVHHQVDVKMSVSGQGVDADALAKEIEAEVARSLSEGNDPAAIKANLEEIAERHGGKIDEFKDD
jgi:hypothetical protein